MNREQSFENLCIEFPRRMNSRPERLRGLRFRVFFSNEHNCIGKLVRAICMFVEPSPSSNIYPKSSATRDCLLLEPRVRVLHCFHSAVLSSGFAYGYLRLEYPFRAVGVKDLVHEHEIKGGSSNTQHIIDSSTYKTPNPFSESPQAE